MKKSVLFALIIATIFTNYIYSQSVVWTNHGKGPQNTYGDGIAHDNNGNIYITGDFRDSIRFGNLKIAESNFGSPYTAKFDSLGNPIWLIKDIGGDGIVFDGGSNLYAFTQNDQTLKKSDFSGNVLWSKTTFTSSTFGSNGIDGVYATPNYYYITGHYSGDAYFENDTIYNTTPNNGNWDIFIAKFNATTGVHVWAKTAGGKGLDKGYGLYVNTLGHVYNTGYFRDTAMFGGNQHVSQGLQDAYVSKYDVNGNIIWSKSFGSTGFDLCNTIVNGTSGELYTMGRFDSQIAMDTYTITGASVNSYINKIDANGTVLWAKAIAGNEEGSLSFSNNKLAFSVSSNNGLNLYAHTQTSLGGTDILIGELDPSGNTLWAKLYGGSSNDEGSAVTKFNNSVYFTGSFNSTANFDSFNYTSMASWDVVVGKINNSLSTNINSSESQQAMFTAFPNPTKNIIHIKNNINVSDIHIYNTFGQQLNITPMYSNENIIINMEHLEAGVYFLEIKNNTKTQLLKIMKERN